MESTHHTFVLRTLLATDRSAINTVANPTRTKLAASCLVTKGNSKISVVVNGSVVNMPSSYRTLTLVDVFMSRNTNQLVFCWRWEACVFQWLLRRCNEQGLEHRLIPESFIFEWLSNQC
jgi:hypothetical protein